MQSTAAGKPLPEDPPIPPPDIFTFESLAEYLDAWFTHAREQSSTRSYRWFARKLDISPGYLANFAKGRRPLPKALVQPFAEMMGLGVQESAYFEALVELARAKSELGQREARARLSGLRRMEAAETLPEESSRVWTRWSTFVVREVFRLTTRKTPEAISEVLIPNEPAERIRESIDVLQKYGALVSGEVVTTGGHQQAPSARTEDLVRYHESALEMARDAIRRFTSKDRFVSTLQIPVTEESEALLRKELARAIERWLDLGEHRSGDVRRVIQIGVQMFPLTEDLRTTPFGEPQDRSDGDPD